MSGQFLEINGIRVYLVSANGPEMRTDKDAVDLMSAASDQHAEFFAIPVERLGDAFFELRTSCLLYTSCAFTAASMPQPSWTHLKLLNSLLLKFPISSSPT